MRCWIGTEVEHNKNYGNTTLFIDSPAVYAFRVIKVLKDNNLTNISLYFGANERDVVIFVATPEEVDFLRQNYKLIIETEKFYPQVSYNLFDNIIVRFSNNKVDIDPDRISLKYKDRSKSVSVLNITDSECETTLEDLLEDGTFKGNDKIIYEDK